jgi:hypothetical protein
MPHSQPRPSSGHSIDFPMSRQSDLDRSDLYQIDNALISGIAFLSGDEMSDCKLSMIEPNPI